ncbi:hypothetical protein ACFVU2_09155 [Leifsonia sp. NPDC058194]|uniref:hypothetical protein n=1 Tax=Leifsonia sp. NPDC058194 TaxID=3346374 RepID=UPI0036DA1F87
MSIVLSRTGRDAEATRFWIGVFRRVIDGATDVDTDAGWQLMSGISHVATAENFDELAGLAAVPRYLPLMPMIYDNFFAKSRNPAISDVVRLLLKPEGLRYPGSLERAARIAVNRKLVDLIPDIQSLLSSTTEDWPDRPSIARVEDALYRLRRTRYEQETQSAGVTALLADLDGADFQRAAFAANALGSRKATEALPRLRELSRSPDDRLGSEAKAAVKKLEKIHVG